MSEHLNTELSLESMGDFDELVEAGGGWAPRGIFEKMIQDELNSTFQPGRYERVLDLSSKTASGAGSIRYFQKIRDNFGFFPREPPRETLQGAVSLLPIFHELSKVPYEVTPQYWEEKICCHLKVPLAGFGAALRKELSKPRSRGAIKTEELLLDWAMPLLAGYFKLKPNFGITFVRHPRANSCWRRWYLDERHPGRAFLLEPTSRNDFPDERWLICCLIHDGAHLLHIGNFPWACRTTSIHHLAVMEGMAMLAEVALSEMLEQRYSIEDEVDQNFSSHMVLTYCYLGLFERSLRLDFDHWVHHMKQTPEQWRVSALRRFEIDASLIDFSTEFHGMPGLPTLYAVGAPVLRTDSDIHSVLNGEKTIDYINRISEFCA